MGKCDNMKKSEKYPNILSKPLSLVIMVFRQKVEKRKLLVIVQ